MDTKLAQRYVRWERLTIATRGSTMCAGLFLGVGTLGWRSFGARDQWPMLVWAYGAGAVAGFLLSGYDIYSGKGVDPACIADVRRALTWRAAEEYRTPEDVAEEEIRGYQHEIVFWNPSMMPLRLGYLLTAGLLCYMLLSIARVAHLLYETTRARFHARMSS